ncbi:MAG: RAP domain-containing protein [Candidatus Endonucleobacter bathymodioli]|uniref:RAP domain-containing protein n=1 Tax=Candidatus Endonucleibacter bathymodioli TaxID=539814 RepID=A0AA90NLJ8_9GAMM|nr:RAP domain-containing protein [Candidatus Endonucleobacter bathymodioli]
MDVLLRTIRSPYDDDMIQRAFRKIVAKLHCYDTELQKWSVQTIARVAKGVSRLRDYSSEKFIAQLAEIYMEKRNDDESMYGIMILSAICHLPIESSKIIKTSVKLASVLSNNAYSNMYKKDKLSLFWGITILDFVVHEKWKKASSHLKTKDRIIKLTKTISEIDQDTINQHPIFPADWQLEFINITYFYRPHQLNHPKSFKGDNKAESDLEGHIYDLIKASIPSLRINTNYRISQFPVDIFLSSRSMSTCLLVEADGPTHYFKGSSDKLHTLAKDRFIEFVLQEKLGHKVIRINYQDAYKSKCRKQFIKKILAVFPNYAP